MNGRCHLPERQRLPNLRHVPHFLSTCPPLQEQWQGASIDIKAAHKRMLIKEDERGALLCQFENKTYAYRTAHSGAKTSARHWEKVSGALLRLLHKVMYFRHPFWVYVDDFLFLFPDSTAPVQFAIATILLIHRRAYILEEIGIRQPPRMEWMDHPSPADDSKLTRLQVSEDTAPHFQLATRTSKKSSAFFFGQPPLSITLGFCLLPFIVTFSHSQPQTTVFVPQFWEHFLEVLNDDAIIYPRTTNFTYQWVPKSQSSLYDHIQNTAS